MIGFAEEVILNTSTHISLLLQDLDAKTYTR